MPRRSSSPSMKSGVPPRMLVLRHAFDLKQFWQPLKEVLRSVDVQRHGGRSFQMEVLQSSIITFASREDEVEIHFLLHFRIPQAEASLQIGQLALNSQASWLSSFRTELARIQRIGGPHDLAKTEIPVLPAAPWRAKRGLCE